MVIVEKEIRFVDLFGGIGGFRRGLEQTNRSRQHLPIETRSGKHSSTEWDKSNSETYGTKGKLQNSGTKDTRFKCVWYCDIDKYAVQTYNRNFSEDWQPTDIRSVDAHEIPNHDILCAGFPCQAFSIAWKRKGFDDTRGTLFFEICRVLEAKRPRLVFLENVKGLLNHDEGKTFIKIISSLHELGYELVEWEVLNSKNFGVSQNRERVFIVGHLGEGCSKQVFPVGTDAEEVQGIFGEEAIMIHQGVLRKGEYGNGFKNNMSFTVDQTCGRDLTVYDRKGFDSRTKGFRENENESPTLSTKMGTGGNNVPMISGCIDANYYKNTPPSHLKKGRPRPFGINDEKLRRLTPTECERLQGFPDNWTNGISDTQRYKQLGNAVTVNVIEAIGKRILETWN